MCQIEQTPPSPWFKLNPTAILNLGNPAPTGGFNVWIRTDRHPTDYLSDRLVGTKSVTLSPTVELRSYLPRLCMRPPAVEGVAHLGA